jgi:chromosome transmission fidelity protein 18
MGGSGPENAPGVGCPSGMEPSQQRLPSVKADLDAVLAHQGGHVPSFGRIIEKENMNDGNNGVDDDLDMMLDLEEDAMFGLDDVEDHHELDGEPLGLDEAWAPLDNISKGTSDLPEEEIEVEKATMRVDQMGKAGPGGDDRVRNKEEEASVVFANVIPNRDQILPQRDAMNATDRYVTVTAVDGPDRVYAPIQKTPSLGANSLSEALRRSKGSLLATKIDDLLAAVEKDQFERVLQETKAAKRRRKIDEKRNKAILAEKAEGQEISIESGNGLAEKSKRGAGLLWVEKYAPKGFLDLLSDELINREVVKWMKEWDQCVFGRAVASNGDRQSEDALKRPEQKIILLAGPPGLGKTTLAHVVARHCGYRPLEINASDERNGPALVSKIIDAMEMTSIINDKRPNCIIVDEIDGASGGGEGRSAIGALVKLAQAKPVTRQKKGEKEEVDIEKVKQNHQKKKVHAKEKPLTRPVICICNDLYAPVLRPLRDVAKVFVVKPPRSDKVVERLQTICKREKLKSDKSTLRGLVDKTECDIRSCLNTMQFIAKKQKTMRLSDISSVGAGQKDISVSVFRLWKELLHLRQGVPIVGKLAETDSQRCLRRYNILSDFGDQDLVLGGMYESLPSIIHFDMALLKTCSVLENVQLVDVIQKRVARFQDFSLMKYLPACILRIAGVLAGPENPSVRWPRMIQYSRKEMADRNTMLHKWRLGMRPENYASLGKTPALLDVLPFLPWITSPSLRPVSRHLYSKEERTSLEKVVDTMVNLGFSYSLEEDDRSSSGDELRSDSTETLVFNPPLHNLWKFDHAEFYSSGMHPKPRIVPMPTRQMVLHELDMEKIKRSAEAHQSRRRLSSNNGTPQPVDTPLQSSSQGGLPKSFTGAVPTTLAQRLEESKKNSTAQKSGLNKPRRKRNWLEQLKDKESTRDKTFICTQGGTKKSRAEDTPVLYKFHEGYTNAVKKPVKMLDLM